MKEIFIDGAMLKDREKAYSYLFDVFGRAFGKNLDALYDVLTDLTDTEIVFGDASAVLKNLGDYGEKMLRCFGDADRDNSMLKVIFK